MKKTYEVVYNACYGGFRLSERAVLMLISMFHEGAKKSYEDPFYKSEREKGRLVSYRIEDLDRHDKRLLEIVHNLKDAANGFGSDLQIEKLWSPVYRIEEHDGLEEVIQPPGGDHDWSIVE